MLSDEEEGAAIRNDCPMLQNATWTAEAISLPAEYFDTIPPCLTTQLSVGGVFIMARTFAALFLSALLFVGTASAVDLQSFFTDQTYAPFVQKVGWRAQICACRGHCQYAAA